MSKNNSVAKFLHQDITPEQLKLTSAELYPLFTKKYPKLKADINEVYFKAVLNKFKTNAGYRKKHIAKLDKASGKTPTAPAKKAVASKPKGAPKAAAKAPAKKAPAKVEPAAAIAEAKAAAKVVTLPVGKAWEALEPTQKESLKPYVKELATAPGDSGNVKLFIVLKDISGAKGETSIRYGNGPKTDGQVAPKEYAPTVVKGMATKLGVAVVNAAE
jgi:hypothetical protein